MAVPQHEVERRVAAFTQALRDNGMRLTHQRLEVVREIAATDEHPDVEEVYRGVRERVPTISLDTVYRTLAVLASVGLVTKVAATAGAARYDANIDHHHHFVCTRCGLVRDVVSPSLDGIRAPSEAGAYGAVESVEVQLRGVCEACAAREKAPPA